MKLVAFGAGKKFGNTETFIKQAMMGAESMGVEVEYVRLPDMVLDVCTVCEKPCPMSNDINACPHKDDAIYIIEKFLDSDGVIIGAPVYSLTPGSLLFAFRDRIFGPKMDVAGAKVFGAEHPFVKGRFKERPGALISVGGARTEHWVSQGLPGLYTTTFSAQTKVVDMMNVTCVADYGAAATREDLLERAWNLGRNVAHAMLTGDHSYAADAPQGRCPSCHLSNLIWKPGEQKVTCVVCGIQGNIVVKDGKADVEWPRDDEDQNRLAFEGKVTHLTEIQDVKKVEYAAVQDRVDEAMKKFRAYEDCVVKSPTKEARKAALLKAAMEKKAAEGK